jgi:hypothetical protein
MGAEIFVIAMDQKFALQIGTEIFKPENVTWADTPGQGWIVFLVIKITCCNMKPVIGHTMIWELTFMHYVWDSKGPTL